MATPNKFTLRQVFKQISDLKPGSFRFGGPVKHFGVIWKIKISKTVDNFLSIEILCAHSEHNEKWSIRMSNCEFRVTTFTGKNVSRKLASIEFRETQRLAGIRNFAGWEDVMSNFQIDDTLIVEIHVENFVMEGVEKKRFWKFNESMEEFSDVVLVVDQEKFYVSKLYLASQSTYFEAMFLREFDESKKSEITLKDINAKDFQNFLELLYGENPIDEFTIDGIVHLAEMYDAKLSIRKCEEFLMEKSEKSLKEKLQLAHRYNLKNLKDYCLSKITTVADIRSVLAYDTSEMDLSVVGALLQKSLTLHDK